VNGSRTVKYSELFCTWLTELGYTHCFFVAGGAVMHLLDGARKRFTCVAFVHEVAAGIAAEYFNESGGEGKAFVLVTAGPGLTNIVTAVANAWLESRELLIVGGQVKRPDLASGGIRQRGIQEIDGRSIVSPITVASVRVEEPWSRSRIMEVVAKGRQHRPGPVFMELCLDAQGAPVDAQAYEDGDDLPPMGPGVDAELRAREAVARVAGLLRQAERPLLLIGGGVTRDTAKSVRGGLKRIDIPVMTTWNGADRVSSEESYYVGRPNTWGERSANVILRQADCIVALGTRLGLQQTGFNWKEFGRHATLVQVDIDRAELEKGHPKVDVPVAADANTLLRELVTLEYGDKSEWLTFARSVRELLPLDDAANTTAPGYVSPYAFCRQLSAAASPEDLIIPCSSGGGNSVPMQSLELRGQTVVTNKGLASMGVGLAGAIGAALAHPQRRTLLIEGDGGFAQNLQELGTAAINALNLKIFIFANNGYASIRSTQNNYFGGAYLGCDAASGLGFPDWHSLFPAFGIPVMMLDERGLACAEAGNMMRDAGPRAFIVPIDPLQTYYPRITSQVTATGSMESNPLHLMTPELPADIAHSVFRYEFAEERI